MSISSSSSQITVISINIINTTCLAFFNVYVVRQSEISSSFADKDQLKGEGRCVLSRSQVIHDEHPLSLGKSSAWNLFFQVHSLSLSFSLLTSDYYHLAFR